MQLGKNPELKFTSLISKHNSDYYINQKAYVKFSLIIVLGVLSGAILFFTDRYLFSQSEISQASLHFSGLNNSFELFDDFRNSLVISFELSKSEMRFILLIFISGFTYFGFLFSSSLSFAKGLILGYSACYLTSNFFEGNIKYFCLYITVKSIVCAIIAVMAVSAYIFSYEFRAIKHRFSVLRRSPATYKYVFCLFAVMGSVFLLNYLYCIVSTLLN